jgi:putative sigma-54 modulation protein
MINSSKLNVTIAFKGMDSSDSLKDYAEKRAQKISKHMHHLTHCHFVCLVEKDDQVAQVHVVSGDFEARAESRQESLYAAIDEVTDKLATQSRKHKEKATSHAGKPHHNEEDFSEEE